MNRNFINALIFTGLTMLSIIACKKNNVVVDKTVIPLSTSKFNTAGAADTIRTYYIKSTNDPFKLPVGITTVSDKDRTVNFAYSSPTAAQGTQYNSPASLVIPAGKSLDSLKVTGLFAGYPLSTRKDTLKIQITGGDVAVSSYKNTFYLILRKYCDVFIADLGGNYTNTRETTSSGGSPYGPYTSTVTLTPIAGSTTSANVSFGDFWDSGMTAVGTINWSDPGNFTVSIPQQYSGVDYAAGQPLDFRTSPGQVSTFSSCEQTFSLTVDFIVRNYPTAGLSAYYSQNYKINIKR